MREIFVVKIKFLIYIKKNEMRILAWQTKKNKMRIACLILSHDVFTKKVFEEIKFKKK